MKHILSDSFKEALHDYVYLLERGFSQKSVLKLVGDRYRLDRVQRMLLFRGIANKDEAGRRNALITKQVRSLDLSIDSYNVFLTIANYLLGRPLYVANDGFLRDVGEVYKTALEPDILNTVINLVFSFLQQQEPKYLIFYLDSPVAFSGELASHLRSVLVDFDLKGRVEVVKSPDYYLKRTKDGIVATSDSVIISNCKAKVFDLAREVLEAVYNPSFIRLDRRL